MAAPQQNISPELQQQLQEYQSMQNQMQTLRIQFDGNQRELAEIKATLKEIKDLNDEEELYKSIGSIFLQPTLRKLKMSLSIAKNY